ncbi:ornithine carbamoyltransferase [Thermus aquaticus]|uniref:Ornithine carbamoyltransferase n=1 Tax=Thermus aquaticus (strain ATCC BAA-2747 / Y51MC23) TaxID=498848 RepID=A0ABM5VM02_THEA5|nr:ornithine carbamoyltransferase [Thermus aquaticus]ALJ91170.1 ornithine carbamoyltransferase [Thermus aquaticus Y51MC23]
MGGETLTLPKDLLDFSGYTKEALKRLLDLAEALKRERYRGEDLKGKSLALLFEKPSLRTRTTLEVAMVHLGGHALYLDQKQVGIGEREPVRDIAKNLERFVEGIAARVYRHRTVEELARHARIPVINALSDRAHPLQALADLLTLKEAFGGLEGLEVAWVGDGNNVLASLLEVAPLVGLKVRVATPRGYEPEAALLARAGAFLTHDPKEAVLGAHALYTDVWTSMGQEAEREKRLRDFQGFQVNGTLLDLLHPDGVFLHCLPAHYGEETTEEAVFGPRSRVFDQAENRLHTAKAVLLTLLK